MELSELIKKLEKLESEFTTLLNKIESRSKNLDDKLLELDQCIHFNKRLIAGLQKAEKDNNVTLLPAGVFYGIEIK